jgi:hypothetical protein
MRATPLKTRPRAHLLNISIAFFSYVCKLCGHSIFMRRFCHWSRTLCIFAFFRSAISVIKQTDLMTRYSTERLLLNRGRRCFTIFAINTPPSWNTSGRMKWVSLICSLASCFHFIQAVCTFLHSLLLIKSEGIVIDAARPSYRSGLDNN